MLGRTKATYLVTFARWDPLLTGPSGTVIVYDAAVRVRKCLNSDAIRVASPTNRTARFAGATGSIETVSDRAERMCDSSRRFSGPERF